ncbi:MULTISPECIES: sensor histidine kinase [unclassified Streptomyces]|uniref:sensor histidine kinase n=1 Tax=unclassified Streptomyces TaxID=2593676 RepID=UPI000B899109|nr:MULTISPECIES: sensor histidine kinase [unclassified Streptomyces]MYS24502.1 HAMP domain-containing protein [Streptomyces sp. SID4948]
MRPGAAVRPGHPAGWTTRRWLVAGACAALVVLTALAVTGAWVFARSTEISNRLVDRSTPALVSSVQLEQSLTDQETGVRGYGLTGQQSFLAPYTNGLTTQASSTARLRVLLADDKTALADLQRLLDRAQTWQQRFARPVAASPGGAPIALATERADEAKHDFDAVRAASGHLQQTLQNARDQARSDLQGARDFRDLIFSVIALVILVMTGLVFAGLRRGVTLPLGQLSDDVRRVAEGHFDHHVSSFGPADLRSLAQDVESMRERLVAELAFSDAARAQLDDQATDLRRSNAELEQFAYVASHDLQEPLRKVASFCQLLQRRYGDQLDDRAGQYIEYAVDGANRMQTLINDLLAFSRVGRLHSDTSTVDLEQLFGRTVDALSMVVEESGAEVTHDPLPVVTGDATQLGMLLQNLVSNAIKFRSPERPVRVRVSVERQGELWSFAIADNGIGIAPEFAEKVFVIFQRLHTRDAYPGNGIGLALCKKIVEFHGGTITIDPDHRPGTRFTFTLPGPAAAPVEPAAEAVVR